MRRAGSLLMVLAAARVASAGGPARLSRLDGVDAESGIHYVLISLDGRSQGATQPATPPRLTAQCTRDAAGKLRLEVMADRGAAAPLAFVPPWKPRQGEPFPPPVQAVSVWMEFLGYVREKPVRRQWDRLYELPDQLRYAAPKLASRNLEEFSYYLKMLNSLPRLRLAVPGEFALEFDTAPWLAALRAEPLCQAAGLQGKPLAAW